MPPAAGRLDSRRRVRAAAEMLASLSGARVWRIVIALGGLGQLAGAVLFVLNMWSRIRMPG